MLLTDRDGREPNKTQAATVQQIVAIVEQTEQDNPNATRAEILQRVDGFFRGQPDAPRLAAQYGGSASDWAKVTSWSYKAADGAIVEVHAYQHIPTGKIVEFKSIWGR